MKLYTLQETQYLIKFYTEILVGTSIEPPQNIFITSLESIPSECGNYRLICRVKEHQGFTFIDDIEHVCQLQGIVLPQEVLDNR